MKTLKCEKLSLSEFNDMQVPTWIWIGNLLSIQVYASKTLYANPSERDAFLRLCYHACIPTFLHSRTLELPHTLQSYQCIHAFWNVVKFQQASASSAFSFVTSVFACVNSMSVQRLSAFRRQALAYASLLTIKLHYSEILILQSCQVVCDLSEMNIRTVLKFLQRVLKNSYSAFERMKGFMQIFFVDCIEISFPNTGPRTFN